MDTKFKSKYLAKTKDSFKTKMNLFVFNLALKKKCKFEGGDFLKFVITEDLVLKYTAEYWQKFEYELVDNALSGKEIYNNIEELKRSNATIFKELESEYINSFSTIFPEEQFEKLLDRKDGNSKCHYCNITIKELESLSDKKRIFKKNFRGWSMEIDRKDSNFEYKPENCVMACYWCNNAKTDEFSYSEFKKFVGPSIQKIWENRLK